MTKQRNTNSRGPHQPAASGLDAIPDDISDDGTDRIYRATDTVPVDPRIWSLLRTQCAVVWPLAIVTVVVSVLTAFRLVPWWPGRVLSIALVAVLVVVAVRSARRLKLLVSKSTAVNASSTRLVVLGMVSGLVPMFFAMMCGVMAVIGASPFHWPVSSFGVLPLAMLAFAGAVGRSPTPPSCAACRYDLTGLSRSTERCPECGGALAGEVVYFRRKLRPLPIVLAVVIMVIPFGFVLLRTAGPIPPPVQGPGGVIMMPDREETFSERLIPTAMLLPLARSDPRAAELALNRSISDDDRGRVIDALIANADGSFHEHDRNRLLVAQGSKGHITGARLGALLAWLEPARLDGVVPRPGDTDSDLILVVPVGLQPSTGDPWLVYAVAMHAPGSAPGSAPDSRSVGRAPFTGQRAVPWSTLQFGGRSSMVTLRTEPGVRDTSASVWIVVLPAGAAPEIEWGPPDSNGVPQPSFAHEPWFVMRRDWQGRVEIPGGG